MKYRNANSVLPEELLKAIQQYVEGEYLYIPIKEKRESIVPTDYERELQMRDKHIYTKVLEGVSKKKLSDMYHLSESSIRRIVINQRREYEQMKDRIRKISNKWDIESGEPVQVYDTAWRLGEHYILKVYENVNMLERNMKILTILDGMAIPVGKILRTKENKAFAEDEQYYYILTEKLEGGNIVSLKENPGIVREMGRIIANLHIAFLECEKQETFWDNSLLGEMKGWIKASLRDSGWECVEEAEFEAVLRQLEALYDRLPVQLIHRDVHFGNFLFESGRFSGYIDFDLSQRNIRIFDLCYFLLGLLSEEEKLEVAEEEWFELLEQVFAGYQERIELIKEEKLAVPHVMKAIELLFAAWFSEQDDRKCVENAMKIFDFVDENTDRIVHALCR